MPLKQPLTVVLLSYAVGDTQGISSPRIKYSYYIAKNKNDDQTAKKNGVQIAKNKKISRKGHNKVIDNERKSQPQHFWIFKFA